ncbi:hypothetical protein BC940DRAFT_305113 [Gongronella butleri]|nr:hypothetical protein BC940DRAFT_305113 [Gongronella butleri]
MVPWIGRWVLFGFFAILIAIGTVCMAFAGILGHRRQPVVTPASPSQEAGKRIIKSGS